GISEGSVARRGIQSPRCTVTGLDVVCQISEGARAQRADREVQFHRKREVAQAVHSVVKSEVAGHCRVLRAVGKRTGEPVLYGVEGGPMVEARVVVKAHSRLSRNLGVEVVRESTLPPELIAFVAGEANSPAGIVGRELLVDELPEIPEQGELVGDCEAQLF